MEPSPEATYERARRLANLAMWTVSLQSRRLKTSEPEDEEFIFRRWSDFHFLIVALTRLRRAATLATKIQRIESNIKDALKEFDLELPNLKTMRDVAEHIDDYAVDSGINKDISRKSLEVSKYNSTKFEQLGFQLDTEDAIKASHKLFNAIRNNPPSGDINKAKKERAWGQA